MANVSYLRAPVRSRAGGKPNGGAAASPGRFGRGRYVLGGVMLVVVAVVAALALVLVSAHATLTADSGAIAKVGMPLGGGTIQSVTIVTGPHSRRIPVDVRGDPTIWPRGLVPAGQRLTVDVVVKRPGWIAWLAGSTEKLHLTLTTPVASLRSHYLTVNGRSPLRLRFKAPIQVYSLGSHAGHLQRHLLASPRSVITVPRSAEAGTIFVSAAPRAWESSHQAMVSWFPGGRAATAVADPAPGATIKSGTPITLTFSKPVSKALGSHLPPVSPPTQGSWTTVNGHTIVFRPEGYGYGLGAKVQLALPSGVKLVGGQQSSTSSGGSWNVPAGSTVRLQQVLALLGYLPLRFRYAGSGVGLTPQDQEAAAVAPPRGKFSWRWANTPAALKGFWQVGASGTMTRGALMAFENDHGLLADGVAGPAVWKSLIGAVLSGHRSSSGYTFVSVSVASQSLTLWHDGSDVITGTPVNTGIASAPTATGTYPVFEHLPVTTMSGTNPDGSHYSDPGIPDVSYFNGGDALHGFTRAQYGSPQSLGCVEMPFSVAAKVFPYTPVGTLVHVA
ncbi:MAG: L,D-transpeptidase family protein [Solirubrobacteraceae bacterium]